MCSSKHRTQARRKNTNTIATNPLVLRVSNTETCDQRSILIGFKTIENAWEVYKKSKAVLTLIRWSSWFLLIAQNAWEVYKKLKAMFTFIRWSSYLLHIQHRKCTKRKGGLSKTKLEKRQNQVKISQIGDPKPIKIPLWSQGRRRPERRFAHF